MSTGSHLTSSHPLLTLPPPDTGTPPPASQDGRNEHTMISVMQRALEFQRNLPRGMPNDLIQMKKYNVSGSYWLRLSADFCKYLPSKRCKLAVVDQENREYAVNYLSNSLSARWRNFAKVHGLKEGDVLIFQRTEPRKLKVYIFKESVTQVGGAPGSESAPGSTPGNSSQEPEGSEMGANTEKKKIKIKFKKTMYAAGSRLTSQFVSRAPGSLSLASSYPSIRAPGSSSIQQSTQAKASKEDFIRAVDLSSNPTASEEP